MQLSVYLGTKPLFHPAPELHRRIASAQKTGAVVKRTVMAHGVVFHAYWPTNNRPNPVRATI